MTVQASNLESEHLPDPAGAPQGDLTKVAGQSPTRLGDRPVPQGQAVDGRRSSSSRLYMLAAIAAPFLVKFGVLDPFSFHQDLTDPSTGGLPIGDFGGISWDHPLGVEPGTGRDVLSRIWYGITFSLAIALSATIIAIVRRHRARHHRRLHRRLGRRDHRPDHRPDAVLPVRR